MKKYIPAFLTGLFGLTIGVFGGPIAIPSEAGIDSAEAQKRHALMADYIWLNARLKQDPVIDLSVGTTEEWSHAYIDAVTEQKIKLPDVQTPTNLNTVMQADAGAKGAICNNPNSIEVIPIAEPL